MILFIICLAIGLQIFLTIKKVNPFISLLLVAIFAGILLGMPPKQLIKSIETGVGQTMGGLALVIFLGAILGKILETGGATTRISNTLIQAFGLKHVQWAVLLTGFMIGLPLYYNAGFIILVPLIFTLARSTKLPLLYIAIPMAASLSTTHCFLPPHPGPVVLVNVLQADLGQVLIMGLCISVPAVILAGPVLGRYLQRIPVKIDGLFGGNEKNQRDPEALPGTFSSFLIGLMPVLLITFSVIGKYVFKEDSLVAQVLSFVGDTTIALLISVLLAMYIFGIRQNYSVTETMKWVQDSVSGIAMIVLIITAGGVFKQVLTDSGTADYISSFSEKWNMPPILFAWVITALLRITLGSATVAGITAAGIVSPLAMSGAASPELLVLAVGSGSVFGSHVNDSGFWMFKEFFNLDLKQTFMSWTVMESLISVIGLLSVLMLDVWL